MLGDFNAKLGKENIFNPTSGNDNLHQDSNDNSVGLKHYVASKNVVDKSMIIPHRNIHMYTWISADMTILTGELTVTLITIRWLQ